jgi:hypothetical protein
MPDDKIIPAGARQVDKVTLPNPRSLRVWYMPSIRR